MLTAWRAGAAEAVVVARDQDTAAHWRATEANLPIPVRVVTPEDGQSLGNAGDLLLVQTAQVHANQQGLGLLVKAGTELSPGESAALEGFIVPVVIRVEHDGLTVSDLLEAAGSPHRRLTIPAPPGAVRYLDSETALREADRNLYRGLASISDGYVDRVLNRHISGWFTRRIINLPITPNAVTWFHFTIGMLGAGLMWQGSYWYGVLGVLLFQLSAALDCSDGEVARLKFQYSKFGSWLDVAADNVVNIAVFIAVAKSVYLRHGLGLGLTLGALMVSGVLMCIVVVLTMAKLQERRRPGEASTLAVTNRLSSSDQGRSARQTTMVEAVINEATSRDFSVLVVACTLLGRLDWFGWLAGIGSHVFWIVFGWIQWSMLRRQDG